MTDPTDAYSEVADAQLGSLEQGDPRLYNAVLAVCGLVFHNTSTARTRSSTISTPPHGVTFAIAVPGHFPYKVFWKNTPDGPRIEAVFPR